MAHGFAVIAGLSRVDPTAYGGGNPTSGCQRAEDDADRIIGLLAPFGYEIACLKTAEAKAESILDNLSWAADKTRAGDIFVFYFAGTGGRRIDSNGDETDGFDETLFAFDRPIGDEELDEKWRAFPEGVRIVMISDSCRSGVNFGIARASERSSIRPLSVLRTSRKAMKASLIYIGAARDEKQAVGLLGGGAFTIALCEADAPDFPGGYRDLFRIVSDSLSSQKAQFNLFGPGTEDFVKQKPFAV